MLCFVDVFGPVKLQIFNFLYYFEIFFISKNINTLALIVSPVAIVLVEQKQLERLQ